MTRLENITKRNTTYTFIKDDVGDFVVKGNVTFNKNDVITDVNGNIYNILNIPVANFSSYSFSENPRYNINDCQADLLQEISALLNTTIQELKEINLYE